MKRMKERFNLYLQKVFSLIGDNNKPVYPLLTQSLSKKVWLINSVYGTYHPKEKVWMDTLADRLDNWLSE